MVVLQRGDVIGSAGVQLGLGEGREIGQDPPGLADDSLWLAQLDIRLWKFDRGTAEFGERGGTRTLDPMIKSHVLYRLSYALT
jgi:hypothetical protein